MPDDLADDIRARTDDGLRRGFGCPAVLGFAAVSALVVIADAAL